MPTRERRPFGALVRASGDDVEAAAALASAYADLPSEYRRRLIAATVEDAADEKINPGPALAAFLAVESDRVIAEHLQEVLADVPKTVLAPTAQGAAWLERGEDGGATIVDPLYGSFVMLWAMRWKSGGEVDPLHGAMTTQEQATEWISTAPPMLPVSREEARAAMVDAFWRHRVKFGRLPPHSAPFAQLL